jgi:hypothetical protein
VSGQTAGTQQMPVEEISREKVRKGLEVLEDRLKEGLKVEGPAEGPANRLKGLIKALTDYLVNKAYPHEKLPLAVLALASLGVHQSLAVLSPMCPEDYQAQVDALRYVLDNVLHVIDAKDNPTEDIYRQLTDMLTLRLLSLSDFTATCQEVPHPDVELRKWQGKEVNVPLTDYTGKLYDNLREWAGKDSNVPLIADALSLTFLHLLIGRPYAGRCPDLVMTYFKGLERIVGDVVVFVRGGTINLVEEDARQWLTVMLALRLKHFLEFIAYCHGIDLRLDVELRNCLPEVTVLRASPVPVRAGGD